MKIKELIKILKRCNSCNEVRFYYLKEDNLELCKYETVIETTDNGVEFTIQNHKEVAYCGQIKIPLPSCGA
jgi:hypothetical protein